MTDDEYTAFYDAAAPLSFQNTYLTSLQDISSSYGCDSITSCSPAELASIQWGSSGVSNTVPTIYSTSNLFKKTLSVYDSYGLYTKQVEYYYYLQTDLKVDGVLTRQAVGNVFNNITGINDDILGTIFVINVGNGQNLTDYEKQLQIPSSANFLLNMRYMVQDYLFGGLTQSGSINQWLGSQNADFI